MRKRIAVLVLVLAALQAAAAGALAELPADLQELLPARPAVLVTFSSFAEVEALWTDLQDGWRDEGEPQEPLDLSAMMAGNLPRFEEVLDPSRPIAMAMDVTSLIMGQEPPLTWVVPLKPSFTDRDALGLDAENSSHAIQGDYLAIHTAPGYLPGAGRPALAADRSPGVISGALDLEAMMQTFGPFIEMGLASIPVGVAETDTLPSGEVLEKPGWTQEEADAVRKLVRALTTSVARLDLGLGLAGDMAEMDVRLAVLPGSPLEMAPQPDFDRALQLTGALPPDADMIMALAMDMTSVVELCRDFYVLNLEREAQALGADVAGRYAAWFAEYLDLVPLVAQPMAAAYGFTEEGMSAHAVMESPDAEADLARIVSVLEGISGVGIGLTMTPLPATRIAGVEVRNWSVDFDPEALTGFAAPEGDPQITGMGPMQAEQMTAMLGKMVPGISLAAADDLIFMAAADDPGILAGMIAAAGGGTSPHPEAARVAAAAGPGVQEVVTGDMLAFLKWMTGIMEEADGEKLAVALDQPLPFEAVYTIDGPRTGMNLSMDLVALQDLIRTLEEMEAKEGMKDYSAEGKEEIRQKAEEMDE